MKRYRALDGLRGLFAATVAIGHGYYWSGNHTAIPISFVLCVDFFFCLTGFVLSTSIIRSQLKIIDWFRSFCIRRLLRLLPTYYFALALTLFLSFPYFRAQSYEISGYIAFVLISLSSHIGFIVPHPLFTDTVPSVAWSASVELWIGLLFFPLVFLLKEKITLLTMLCFIMGSSALYYLIMNSPNHMDVSWERAFGWLPMGSLRALIGFSFGVVALHIHRNTPISSGTLLEIIIIIVIFAIYGEQSYDRRLDYLAPFLSILLIVVFSSDSGILSKALSSRVAQLIGSISYPVYLLHPVVIDFFHKYASAPYSKLTLLQYIISLMLLSAAVHVVLERPMIELSHRWSRHLIKKT